MDMIHISTKTNCLPHPQTLVDSKLMKDPLEVMMDLKLILAEGEDRSVTLLVLIQKIKMISTNLGHPGLQMNRPVRQLDLRDHQQVHLGFVMDTQDLLQLVPMDRRLGHLGHPQDPRGHQQDPQGHQQDHQVPLDHQDLQQDHQGPHEGDGP